MHEAASFGQWLRQRRRALLLTQEELAERIFCSSAMVRKIEAGERVASEQMADLLAESFGVVVTERPAFTQFAKGRLSADAVEHALWQTQHALKAHPTNLAAPLTALIGREQDLERLRKLLITEDERLFTLTGPPGIGKTRLSLQAGIEVLDHFEDGVFFASLAPVSDPELVGAAITRSLGLKESTDVPSFSTLATYLQRKSFLLILDNFEQVLAAAVHVAALLEACPGLKILVTSREALCLRGEQQFPLPALGLPDLGNVPDAQALLGYPAVALFVERAQASMPQFQLTPESARYVATICHRLDGLPLAIELAAARINLLSPRAISARLGTWTLSTNSTTTADQVPEHNSGSLRLLVGGHRDLPARQQTLRRALEWSYDLLDEQEQTLFARMSVFVGGCTLEAVEAVCNAGADLRLVVLDGVASLLSKNLVRQDDGNDVKTGERRLRMLETIHEYAREKLEESSESGDLHREHALYFMRLAEEAEPQMTGPRQQEWLDRFDDEHDNVAAALWWARGKAWAASVEGDCARGAEAEAIEIGLRTGVALRRFWFRRGYLIEGREHLMRLLEVRHVQASLSTQSTDSVEAEPACQLRARPGQLSGNLTAARARALIGVGFLAYMRGDYGSARSLFEESVTLHRQIGDKWGTAEALGRLGDAARTQGDYTSARSLLEESVALFRELGDKRGIGFSLGYLGQVAREQGDYASAGRQFEQSLALFREIGDKWCTANRLGDLGDIAWEVGDYSTARSLFDGCLTLRRELGDKWGLANVLGSLGDMAREQEDYASARSLLHESLVLRGELGDKWGLANSLNCLGNMAQDEGDYTTACSLLKESLVLQSELGVKLGIAVSLSRLGRVIVARTESAGTVYRPGSSEQAALELERGTRLLGAAEGLLETLGTTLFPNTRLLHERSVALARALLCEDAFARAHREGRAMNIEQAITYALDKA